MICNTSIAFFTSQQQLVAQNQTIGGDLTGEPLQEFLRADGAQTFGIMYVDARGYQI